MESPLAHESKTKIELRDSEECMAPPCAL